MEIDPNQKVISEPQDLEQKLKGLYLLSVRILIPFIIVGYGLFSFLLKSKYEYVGSIVIRYIVPVVFIPVLVLLFIWSLVQVKKGIVGQPILGGSLSKQPFLFLGTILFLLFGIVSVGLIVGIFYIFSLGW